MSVLIKVRIAIVCQFGNDGLGQAERAEKAALKDIVPLWYTPSDKEAGGDPDQYLSLKSKLTDHH